MQIARIPIAARRILFAVAIAGRDSFQQQRPAPGGADILGSWTGLRNGGEAARAPSGRPAFAPSELPLLLVLLWGVRLVRHGVSRCNGGHRFSRNGARNGRGAGKESPRATGRAMCRGRFRGARRTAASRRGGRPCGQATGKARRSKRRAPGSGSTGTPVTAGNGTPVGESVWPMRSSRRTYRR